MKTRKELCCVCGEIPSLIRHIDGFVRYSSGGEYNVGVYTSLHPFKLSSMLRVVYQVDLNEEFGDSAAGFIRELIDTSNAESYIGMLSVKCTDSGYRLCLMQLLWIDRRPTRDSLEELLSVGESALRAFYSKMREELKTLDPIH